MYFKWYKYGIIIFCLGIGLLVLSNGGSTTFWRILLKHPEHVAAFSPCSKAVAHEICSIIQHRGKPLRILEVGGGTGALTAGIVKNMQSGDMCDVIELLPAYCEILQEEFGRYPGVSIHCCSILDWQAQEPYDFIVCSLPFNTFDVKFVDKVLQYLKKSLKPGGKMSYVELMWISEWKKYFLAGDARQNLENTLEYMKKFRSQYCKKTVPIYWNFTPIEVHHLEIS